MSMNDDARPHSALARKLINRLMCHEVADQAVPAITDSTAQVVPSLAPVIPTERQGDKHMSRREIIATAAPIGGAVLATALEHSPALASVGEAGSAILANGRSDHVADVLFRRWLAAVASCNQASDSEVSQSAWQASAHADDAIRSLSPSSMAAGARALVEINNEMPHDCTPAHVEDEDNGGRPALRILACLLPQLNGTIGQFAADLLAHPDRAFRDSLFGGAVAAERYCKGGINPSYEHVAEPDPALALIEEEEAAYNDADLFNDQDDDDAAELASKRACDALVAALRCRPTTIAGAAGLLRIARLRSERWIGCPDILAMLSNVSSFLDGEPAEGS